MNIEELVKMPEPDTRTDFHHDGCGRRAFTQAAMLRYGEAVAAAVAKRCIALVIAEDVAPSDFAPGVQECIADAIRREFGEVSNG